MGPLARARAALDRLTRPPLAGAVGVLVLTLSLAAIGPHLAHLKPSSGGGIEYGTGDFPAFWIGAVALHDGQGASLYNIDAQKELQARILGGHAASFQPYLNPPLLAILLSSLVPLGYLPAFYIYDLVCVILLGAALAMIVRMTPAIRAQPGGTWTLILLAASYQPMVLTTLLGQNTPITFALLAGLALALRRGATRSAAIALGLLTFKPQYAVGAGAALLLAGQWPVVFGGAAVGLAHWILGAWWSGVRWPLDMLAFLQIYQPFEVADNAQNHFSWVRTAAYVFPPSAALIVSAAGVLLVFVAWWRFRALGRRGDGAWIALVICGTMLASPHQQYYDVALLVLPVCLLLEEQLARHGAVPLHIRVWLGVAFAGYPLWGYASVLRVQPLFFVLLGVSIWAARGCMDAERGLSQVAARSPVPRA